MIKRIVFVLSEFNLGGIEKHTSVLANELLNWGLKVSVISAKEPNNTVISWVNQGVGFSTFSEINNNHKDDCINAAKWIKQRKRLLKRFRYFTKYFKKIDQKILFELRSLSSSERIRSILENDESTLYVAWEIDLFKNMFFARKGMKCKIAYSEAFSPFRFDDVQFRNNHDDVSKYCVDKADLLIVQTKENLLYYENYSPRVKKYIIHNPLDTKGLPDPYRGNREKKIINFCRLDKQKNIPLLIEAFSDFYKTHPDYSCDVYALVNTPKREEYKKELLAKAKDLGVGESFYIKDAVVNIHKIAVKYAMFVSSSYSEGLSNSMIEALAIGLPCICTDCLGGGAKDIIEDGVNGLLVPNYDRFALADAMSKIADDKCLSYSLSHNASKIKDTLSAARIAEEWKSAIDSIS